MARLSPGDTLGHYEIKDLLGEGGMGQVYRARDTKLHRDVALKILPDVFVSDPDRLARFRREASVLASLNHPNIGQIFGFEDSGTTHALVLELVDGSTLAEIIAGGPKGPPLPLPDALAIAEQIARALEAAHAQGIVHRDLKPANIKVAANGTVKVLDFGLAKALLDDGRGADPSNSPTLTSPARLRQGSGVAGTQAGVLLGTAAYMSPEQARGKAVDKRADIWAFGCVLYEMLTGAQTFGGETLTDMLANVVKTDPDMKALPADTPRGVRVVLRRCLQKDPAKRFHDIADVRIELQEAVSESASAEATAGPAFAKAPAGQARWWIALAMLVAGLALGAVLVRWLSPADPKPLVQLALQRPDSTPIGSQAPVGDIAISRDGRRVAYVTGSQGVTTLAIRALDKLDPLTIADARGPIGPFLSPDGNWIGFFETATTQLKRVPVSGGAPQLICAYTGSPRGASWGEDNRIVFATSSTAAGLLRVAAAGGTPETLTTLDVSKGETGHWFPDVLPGGTGILFSVKQSGVTDGSVAVFDTAAGTRRTLLPGGFARYVKSGHLVYAGASTLQAVAFDIRTLQIQSDPVPVVDHVVTKSSGTASFDIADDGTLAYLSGEAASALRTPVWMDRDRKEEAIKAPVRAYVYPRISPDGRRVAFDIRDQDNDIWTLDLATGSLARLTIDPGLNRGVAWTPDGARIAFSAVRDGKEHVFWQAADGSGAPERLTESSGVHVPSAFTPDGKYLIFQQPGAVPFDLSMVDVTQPAGQRHVTPLLNAPHNEGNGEVSPDGKWIAYESNESGQRTEIFVRPFPNVNSARWQVSNNGGSRPVWLPKTGAELFYLQAAAQGQERGIMSVRIVPGPTFSYGTPRMAITDPPGFAQFQGRVYDVSPDGKKFLFLKVAAAASDPAQLIVVLNWVDELKKLVPGR